MPYHILIIGSDREENGIHKRKAGRLFLEAMKRNGIQWDVHFPVDQAMPDLQNYDAVVFWSYILHNMPAYLESALNIEALARSLSIPIINSVENAHAPHSFFLDRWAADGIKCARSQNFNHFEEIDLNYPLIIRRDGVHQGKDVFRVENANQAQQLIEERQKDNSQANFNLAIEFIDTQWPDGHYRKYRSYIIGKTIIPRHMHTSNHWLVNLENSIVSERSMKEVQLFFHQGDKKPERVMQASLATGHEIVALDYSIDSEGNHVFWEANHHFFMDGDVSARSAELFLKITGLREEDMLQNDEKVIQAFYDLVHEKIKKNQ